MVWVAESHKFNTVLCCVIMSYGWYGSGLVIWTLSEYISLFSADKISQISSRLHCTSLSAAVAERENSQNRTGIGEDQKCHCIVWVWHCLVPWWPVGHGPTDFEQDPCSLWLVKVNTLWDLFSMFLLRGAESQLSRNMSKNGWRNPHCALRI